MYNFRTDLALERREIFRKNNNLEEIDGIEIENKEIDPNLKVTKVDITNQNGEQAIGKPIGTYITIDIQKLRLAEEAEIQKSAEILSEELKEIINKHIESKDDILVVGLGNIYVTPDSLGPKVIRPVSAISPGVLGTTGIETLEILEGVVKEIKPKLLIVIDALASRSIERISSTIQLSDTGIVPGAGVGNTRKEISKNTLGIPVIAIRNTNSC